MRRDVAKLQTCKERVFLRYARVVPVVSLVPAYARDGKLRSLKDLYTDGRRRLDPDELAQAPAIRSIGHLRSFTRRAGAKALAAILRIHHIF
jgi:hypothetical protein